MGIIELGSDVRFVKWTTAQDRRADGQLVDLDKRNRIKYPMPIPGRPTAVQNFSSAYMVHPHLGVDALRYAGEHRADMPPQHLTLRSMWQVGITNGRIPQESSCFICKNSERLITCALCLSTCHESCAEALDQVSRRLGGWHRPIVNQAEISSRWFDPARARIAFCAACMTHVEFR